MAVDSEIEALKADPRLFLEFLRGHSYPVYHRSNLFFRDLQFGLWRYLGRDQTRAPYAEIERLTAEVVAEFERRGILKRINRQSFELNMPEYLARVTLAEDRRRSTEPPKGKPAPATGPAETEPPAATDASEEEKRARNAAIRAEREAARARRTQPAPPPPAEAEATEAAAAGVAPATGDPDEDAARKAKIAELRARMAEARARREEGEHGG